MTLKKMSVAANDIVLNNLVMRDETFKTIPSWCRRVLLNAHFSSAWLSKIPGNALNPFLGWTVSGSPYLSSLQAVFRCFHGFKRFLGFPIFHSPPGCRNSKPLTNLILPTARESFRRDSHVHWAGPVC